ncbi:MAG: nucleotidyltransferase domain-containing protein [Candidatus Odinarchaeota archaeon]|nr:nucleotidyltransferase domain-containing protein [Candidatus Odinarchaeota archaeon]
MKSKVVNLKEDLKRKGHAVKLLAIVGSFARGDWHSGSDVDVLIVCENVSGPYWKRLNDLPSLIVENHAVEYHIYSPEEFIDLAKYARMPVFDLFHEGIIIYADKKFLSKVKKIFDDAVSKFHVVKKGPFLIRKIE